MTVAMENVKEWSGRMKNVEDDSRRLILGVNYSNFLQLISTLCDSAVTMLSLCELWSEALQWRLLRAAWKTCTKAGQHHHSLKLDLVLQSLSVSPCEEYDCLIVVDRPNPVLYLPGIDERSGSSPWGPGQQNSPSFNQGRVSLILTYYTESDHVDIMLLSFNKLLFVTCFQTLSLTPLTANVSCRFLELSGNQDGLHTQRDISHMIFKQQQRHLRVSCKTTSCP